MATVDETAFIREIEDLRQAGRFDEVLQVLERRYAATERMPAPGRTDYFFTLFEWKMLIESYPPAAAALARARDEQARRLLAGEYYVGSGAHDSMQFQRADRFGLVIEMNRTLDDPGSTRAVFLQLEAQDPELARRDAHRALAAIVEMGDFALAERYRRDPLELLAQVNCAAASLPLFPPGREAPRLAGDLMNLTGEVRIAIAVLRGLDRAAEAEAVRSALLAGLANDELWTVAQRELEVPGTIGNTLAEGQMALDAAG